MPTPESVGARHAVPVFGSAARPAPDLAGPQPRTEPRRDAAPHLGKARRAAPLSSRSPTPSSRAKRGICFFVFASTLLPLAAHTQTSPRRPKIFRVAQVRVSAADTSRSKMFYKELLGLQEYPGKCFAANSMCFWVNLIQIIEVVPAQNASEVSRVQEIGFWTNSVKEMRSYLLSSGLRPEPIKTNKDGWPYFEIVDPEAHTIMFTSRALDGDMMVSNTGSSLIHAGFIVRDRAATEHFYKDILGFRPYWHGGMKDDQTDWVSMQVPDGTDWLEFMVNVPPDADQRLRGIMNHIAIGVTDIHATEQRLKDAGVHLTEEPKIGRDGKWQLNVYDPDLTRIEFMEFKPVQKPCCSEFTGPHPQP